MKKDNNRRKMMKYIQILDEMSHKYKVNLHCKDVIEIKEILTDKEYMKFIDQFNIDMETVMLQSKLKENDKETLRLIEFEDQFNELLNRFSNSDQKELVNRLLFHVLSIAVEEYDRDSLDLIITRSLNDVLDLKMSEFRILNIGDSLH